MTEHVRFTVDTGVQIYFCDPEEPLAAGLSTRTPTDSCVSTCPRRRICRATPRDNSTPSPSHSTPSSTDPRGMSPCEAFAEAVASTA